MSLLSRLLTISPRRLEIIISSVFRRANVTADSAYSSQITSQTVRELRITAQTLLYAIQTHNSSFETHDYLNELKAGQEPAFVGQFTMYQGKYHLDEDYKKAKSKNHRNNIT